MDFKQSTQFYWILILLIGMQSCATYKPQFKSAQEQNTYDTLQKPMLSYYLLGDAGKATTNKGQNVLQAIKTLWNKKNTSKDKLLFLGDNIYEKGLPPKASPDRQDAEQQIDAQIALAKQFKGQTIFIPGNHDWYSGLSGLKRQENRVEKALGKQSFLPEDGCPIETISVNTSQILLIVDSQWFLENWDKHPTVNDNCNIKSRNQFFETLEGVFKKNAEKSIVLAIHHPAFTAGSHGGKFAARKHLFPFQSKLPLPGVGSLLVQLRKLGGVSPQDTSHKTYRTLMNRLTTLAQLHGRTVFVSGHEHNLQLLKQRDVVQIVSGSGSKTTATSLLNESQFSFGGNGFVQLDFFKDGSAFATFYKAENKKAVPVYRTVIFNSKKPETNFEYPETTTVTKTTTVYPKAITKKSKFYTWLWGAHYRTVYGTPIQVQAATLDTLLGGLSIVRKGGGHQTRALRLQDNKGRNFALRAVKKSATQYLQTVLFTDSYVLPDFKNTEAESFIADFYTASHPFLNFVVTDLSSAAGIFHTNPKLIYMPKHQALGKYNESFGNELYVIEERPDDGFLDTDSFGKPDAIESTEDVFKKIRRDEKYKVDERAWIRARLFDMLIGDWDRHADQWRWARFDLDKQNRVYKPIPRDRDQAFSNYDGFLLDAIRFLNPVARQLQTFDEDFKNLQGLNAAGSKLDRAFLQTLPISVWKEEAQYLQNKLSDSVIAKAFKVLPRQLQTIQIKEVMAHLKTRRNALVTQAEVYYKKLREIVIITGTDKDDFFKITRKEKGTDIKVFRKKDDTLVLYKTTFIEAQYNKEIWLYGLDDDDTFLVDGQEDNKSFIRLIGGQNNDTYTLNNTHRIRVYDYKSKPNTIKSSASVYRFSDRYSQNTYAPLRSLQNFFYVNPAFNVNPDDGLGFGIKLQKQSQGFKGTSFAKKHTFSATYFRATQGFQLAYNAVYADAIKSWDFLVEANFTDTNFTQNFFGIGNETANQEVLLGLNFNRVRTSSRGIQLGIGKQGISSQFKTSLAIAQILVENTRGRIIESLFSSQDVLFKRQTFGAIKANYNYTNWDNAAQPTLGMAFNLATEIIRGFSLGNYNVFKLNPSVTFYNPISRHKQLVWHNTLQGQFVWGQTPLFYHTARLGANSGLRGFRQQRFAGQRALALNSDLKLHFPPKRTRVFPIQFGVFTGADVGRVWQQNELSDTWHYDWGGGFWLTAAQRLSGTFSVFNSVEGARFAFSIKSAF